MADTNGENPPLNSSGLLAIFEPPKFGHLPMQPCHQREVNLATSWTRVKNESDKIDDQGEAWSSWFVVEEQSFRIGIHEDRESAFWMCFQFAKALSKVCDR